jgi:peptide/nickel transport system substrate-binding protein
MERKRMKAKKLFMLLVVALLAVTALLPARAQSDNVATFIWEQEPDNLNPMYTVMAFAGYTRALYLEGAWEYRGDLSLQPTLVTEIPSVENGGVSEDGLTITLKLRDDIKWSDNTPMTSADFVFTYDMILNDANTAADRSPYDLLVDPSNPDSPRVIAGVSAPDERTVVITFNTVYIPWQTSLFTYVLPKHILQPVFDADGTLDNAEWNRAPMVGSGAFNFVQWEAGAFILFARNENYFNEVAKLDEVFLRFSVDSSASKASLANGEGDLATFLPVADADELQRDFAMQIFKVPSGFNESWYLNLRADKGHPALQDVNVRRAVVMAFDRDTFNQDVNLGLLTTPASFWEGTPYASPNVTALPFDATMAAQLLDEAGWVDSNGDGTRDKDGVELVLRYIASQREIRQQTQQVAKQQLEAIGIGVETLDFPRDQYFANEGPLRQGEFDIAQLSINPAFPDPDTTRFLCNEIPDATGEGANNSGVCLPELDALFAQQAAEVDATARIALFHQIDELLTAQVAWVGIWTDADIWVASARLKGLDISGPSPLWNAEALFIEG